MSAADCKCTLRKVDPLSPRCHCCDKLTCGEREGCIFWCPQHKTWTCYGCSCNCLECSQVLPDKHKIFTCGAEDLKDLHDRMKSRYFLHHGSSKPSVCGTKCDHVVLQAEKKKKILKMISELIDEMFSV